MATAYSIHRRRVTPRNLRSIDIARAQQLIHEYRVASTKLQNPKSKLAASFRLSDILSRECGDLAVGNEFRLLPLYNSSRGQSQWHLRGVLNISKWKKAENIFTEFGRRQIIEKLSRCSLRPLDRDMSTPNIWSDTHIETLWERKKSR